MASAVKKYRYLSEIAFAHSAFKKLKAVKRLLWVDTQHGCQRCFDQCGDCEISYQKYLPEGRSKLSPGIGKESERARTVSSVLSPTTVHQMSYAQRYNGINNSSYMLQVKKQDTFKYYESKVLAVKDIVRTNIHRNLTVEQLAADTCVSYYHLRDIFYAVEGCPIKQYINNYRIRMVADLLQTSDDTLDDIAMQVGYNNKCSLSKAFKKHFGCSPGQFRQNSKQANRFQSTLSLGQAA